jgi:phosphate uptake regulator
MNKSNRELLRDVAQQMELMLRSDGELDLDALDLLADQARTMDRIINQLYRQLAEKAVKK